MKSVYSPKRIEREVKKDRRIARKNKAIRYAIFA